jgi:hypothetical protein
MFFPPDLQKPTLSGTSVRCSKTQHYFIARHDAMDFMTQWTFHVMATFSPIFKMTPFSGFHILSDKIPQRETTLISSQESISKIIYFQLVSLLLSQRSCRKSYNSSLGQWLWGVYFIPFF